MSELFDGVAFRTPACEDHLPNNEDDMCPWCRINELKNKTKWQPIETAPKNFTPILGWCKKRGIAKLELFGRDDGLMITFGHITAHESIFRGPPTHWMPLPEPPEKE